MKVVGRSLGRQLVLPVDQPSGGGFGSTVKLDDGTLVTSYSHAGLDGPAGTDFHIKVVCWRLP